MESIKVPAEYQRLMPYLIVPNAEGFFNFMKNVFQATEKMKMMRDEKTIMHAELKVGDQVIMFSEASKEYPATPGSFFIYVEDADKSFADAIANGATEIDPPDDKDYGRSGGVRDPHGNTWWITSAK
jgi:uncharacterized glyoxalase superfamily protein PhnB